MGSYYGPMQGTTAAGTYAARLDQAMRSASPPVQVRTLAKQLRPDGVESMRRLLRRFLKGERTPGPQVAGEIVAALAAMGADTAALEDDDEESDAMYRDLLDLATQLERIGRLLAERVKSRSAA